MAGSIKLKKQAAEFISLMANPETDKRDSVLAKQLGVSSQTIKKWKKHPELLNQIEDTVRQITDRRMPEVWESLIEEAVEGDVQAARLIFQLRGEHDRREQETKPQQPPSVKIVFSQSPSHPAKQEG